MSCLPFKFPRREDRLIPRWQKKGFALPLVWVSNYLTRELTRDVAYI